MEEKFQQEEKEKLFNNLKGNAFKIKANLSRVLQKALQRYPPEQSSWHTCGRQS